jgi:alanyl-tRNA synthetase
VGGLAEGARGVGQVRLVVHDAGEVASVDDLRALATEVRSRLGEAAAVVAVAGVSKERPAVIVATNAAAREVGLRAGSLAQAAAAVLGGGGGGKDDLAQGGGSDVGQLAAALDAVRARVADAD